MFDYDDVYGWCIEPEDRYEVLSIETGNPGDVRQWCETDTLWKAEAVFYLLAPHGKRLGYEHLTLRDRYTGETLLSVA